MSGEFNFFASKLRNKGMGRMDIICAIAIFPYRHNHIHIVVPNSLDIWDIVDELHVFMFKKELQHILHPIKKEVKDAATIKTYTIKGSKKAVKTQEIQKKLVRHSQMPK